MSNLAESRSEAAQAVISRQTQAAVGGGVLDQEWVNSIRRKLDDKPQTINASYSKCTIHRMPPSLWDFDKKSYIPQIISIGPFHYDKRKDDLKVMEEHKWRYLRSFLIRNGQEQDFLELCLQEVKKFEEQARECYSEKIDLDSNSFVEMMVLDACFIIELFFQNRHKGLGPVSDPILNLSLSPTIRTDLIMLENQIPFFILQHLFDLMNIRATSLAQLALSYFGEWATYLFMVKNSSTNHGSRSNQQFHHLLHFLHSKLVPSSEDEDPISEVSERFPVLPSISQLQEAGIKCKKRVSCGLLDIKYQDGEIEIPTIFVDQTAELLFLNFVAFEQCYSQEKCYFTSYIIFMDYLINSAKDVQILSQKGIIVEKLGSHEQVAALFNKIGRDVWIMFGRYHFWGVSERIHRSTTRLWPRFRAILMRDYFNSPWAFISFLAAVVLLIFTFFQTFFSAFPKFQFG